MVTLEQIQARAEETARRRSPHTAHSLLSARPQAELGSRSELRDESTRGQLWLKAESLQPIGSFKLRGAYNKIASFSRTRTRSAGLSRIPAAITRRESPTRRAPWA